MKNPATPDEVLQQVIKFLLSGKATPADAEWILATLASDPDLIKFFRAEVLAALDRKSSHNGSVNPVKRRKIFRTLAGMGVMQPIFGTEFELTKKRMDRESKAARTVVRKPDVQRGSNYP